MFFLKKKKIFKKENKKLGFFSKLWSKLMYKSNG